MPKRLYFLGPEETFTEQAAKSLARRFGMPWESVPCATLHQAVRATVAGEGLAVLPYYNLYEGLVQETLDLVTEHHLTILAAERVPVRFALGGYVGGTGSEGMVVSSHPKALPQCSTYLQENWEDTPLREVGSTVAAVVRVAETGAGLAIARREAFEKRGVPILAEDIGNRQYGRANFTEFLMIGRAGEMGLPIESDTVKRRCMVAIFPEADRVGLLADILGQIAFFGINLLKIHSRPALSEHETENDPQMFYLEMGIRSSAREFQLCRETLEMRLAHPNQGPGRGPSSGETGEGKGVVRLLGDYPLFCPPPSPGP